MFNAAVIINPAGKVLLKHRKLNELFIGHEHYAQGDRLNVVDTEYGTFGLMICADGFAKDQVIARSLCYMDADVILSPCAWDARQTMTTKPILTEECGVNPTSTWQKNSLPPSLEPATWAGSTMVPGKAESASAVPWP